MYLNNGFTYCAFFTQNNNMIKHITSFLQFPSLKMVQHFFSECHSFNSSLLAIQRMIPEITLRKPNDYNFTSACQTVAACFTELNKCFSEDYKLGIYHDSLERNCTFLSLCNYRLQCNVKPWDIKPYSKLSFSFSLRFTLCRGEGERHYLEEGGREKARTIQFCVLTLRFRCVSWVQSRLWSLFLNLKMEGTVSLICLSSFVLRRT